MPTDRIVERVAARFKGADAIGDPVSLTKQLEAVLDKFASLEPLIPQMREAEAALKVNPHDNVAYSVYSSHKYDFMFKVKNGYAAFHNVAFNLFLAFLQQYDLAPKVRKAVEGVAKFYSRGAVQKPGKGQEVTVYEKYLKEYRNQLALAKLVLSQSKPRGSQPEAVETQRKAGPFTIVNTGGFSDEVLDEVAKVVETAAKLLQRKGLGKICYGDVLVSNTISRSNVLAFYLVSKDEFFVRANLKGKEHDAVKTVLHELGHRLHFKFLQAKDRDIRAIHYKLAMKEKDRLGALVRDPELRPKPGDTLEAKGSVYKVQSVVYDKVNLIKDNNPAQTAKISLAGWIEMKGTAWHAPMAFVSRYAQKNHEENFAEMIAAYCSDRLPEDQVTLLEQVL